jgi:hypothetical protein
LLIEQLRSGWTCGSATPYKQDMALYISIGLIVIAGVWTLFHRPCADDLGADDENRKKLREYIALDIRAASQYCSWYLGLLGVTTSILAAAANRDFFKPVLDWTHLWPFCLAFIIASVALIFIPAGYGTKRFNRLRVIWFRSILCEQAVVIFTCYGAWLFFKALAST